MADQVKVDKVREVRSAVFTATLSCFGFLFMLANFIVVSSNGTNMGAFLTICALLTIMALFSAFSVGNAIIRLLEYSQGE